MLSSSGDLITIKEHGVLRRFIIQRFLPLSHVFGWSQEPHQEIELDYEIAERVLVAALEEVRAAKESSDE